MLTQFLLMLTLALSLTAQALFAQSTGRQPPYFSGRVAMEDGKPPKDRVIIESVCNGVPRQETTVDSKGGGFGFRLGAGNGDVALEAGNARSNPTSRTGAGAASTAPRTAECVIQAKLVGYASTIVYLANISENRPDLGTLVLTKANAPSPAPKDAQKAFDRGVEALKGKKIDEAVKDFEKATQLYPAYADAWVELGQLQMERNQAPEAHASFEAAIKGNDKHLPAYLQLVTMEARQRNWKRVLELTDRAIQFSSGMPQLYLINGVAHVSLKELDAAEKIVQQGLKVDTRQEAPKLRQLMGDLLARRGEFAGAAEQYEAYLLISPFAPDAANVRAAINDLTSRAATKK